MHWSGGESKHSWEEHGRRLWSGRAGRKYAKGRGGGGRQEEGETKTGGGENKGTGDGSKAGNVIFSRVPDVQAVGERKTT